MDIKELVKAAHVNAAEKGFWDDWIDLVDIDLTEPEENLIKAVRNNAIGNRLMLIVGEVAEAQEGLRKDDWDNFREELADVAIRLGDLCGGLGIDLEAEIVKKMDKNKTRPYKHGKAF